MNGQKADTEAEKSSRAIDPGVADSVSVTLRAISDPLRLRILSFIDSAVSGEACVCDLLVLADVSQPTVSHHLKVMRNVGVLESERRGTWVWYRIAPSYKPVISALLEGLAPAAVRAETSVAPPPPLKNAEVELSDIAQQLTRKFSSTSEELVESIVRESYTALAGKNSSTEVLLTRTREFAMQRLNDRTRDVSQTKQVLFVCVANAGRSQLAAAALNALSDGTVTARSAGSNPAGDIHPGVLTHLRELGSDPDLAFPKPLTDDALRSADVVITMGCGDVCPVLPDTEYDDWKISDPGLASEEGLTQIRSEIEARVRALLVDLKTAPKGKSS